MNSAHINKWALVTGGAKRIGRVIALELADAGWDIIIHYNNSGDDAQQLAGEIQTLGRKACLAEIDLSKTKPTEDLIPSLVDVLGPIHVLVNNASLFEADEHDADGRHHKAINLDAPRILSEAFYRQAPPGQTNTILNLLDADPSTPGFSAYNQSKKELRDLTLDMALRFAPRVRVNGIALGAVLPNARQSDEHFEKLVASTPLQARVIPQTVAATVRFLCENSSITGTIISVDGGMHLKLQK